MEHSCNHVQEHDCSSCSSHSSEGCSKQPETIVDVLKAIQSLNRQSTGKMQQLSEKLKDIGHEDTAKHLERCMDDYRKGEMWLAAAISSLDI